MHELFGERFWARETPGWHKLGITAPKDTKLTVSEAMEFAGMTFPLDKIPLRIWWSGAEFDTQLDAVIRGETVDPVTQLLDPAKFLGVVPRDYTILTNQELARHFDPLSEQWPVETVGALHDGRVLFFSLKVGRDEIAGEDVQEYFLLSDARDGSEALRLVYTPVRVVCQNTLTAGLRRASHSLSIAHTAAMEADLDFWKEIIVAMKTVRDETKLVLNMLADVHLTGGMVEQIIKEVYPDPSKPKKLAAIDASGNTVWSPEVRAQEAYLRRDWQLGRDLAARDRLKIKYLYDKLSDEHVTIGGTAYALYNAVAEREDHDLRGDGDAPVISSLWGDRAGRKQKCFDRVVALLP